MILSSSFYTVYTEREGVNEKDKECVFAFGFSDLWEFTPRREGKEMAGAI